MAREILRAKDAPNDGVRRLRELLRFQSAAQVATRLACDATAIRRWSRGDRTPTPESRSAMQEKLGIPVEAWEITTDDDAAVTRPMG
jgi:transcriptional regulator with XRE-family HTH domain